MQVSPVNSCIFNGRLRSTPAFDKLMKISNKKSLERFNEALLNAEFSNDGVYYIFRETTDSNVINGYVDTTFTLLKSDKTPLFNEVVISAKTYLKQSEPLESKKCAILDSFSRALEKIYPQVDKNTEEYFKRSIESKLF